MRTNQISKELLIKARWSGRYRRARVVVVALSKVLYITAVAVAVVMPQQLLTPTTAAPTLILNPRNPLFRKDATPEGIIIGGVEYARAKCLAKKSRRKEPSGVWLFGEKIFRKKDGKPHYYCYDCEDISAKQQLFIAEGTANSRSHLRTHHKRDPDTGEVAIALQKKDDDSILSLVTTYSLKEFKNLVIRWFVVCQLALYMLENDVFRELIAYLSSALASYLPKARSTLRGWIIDEYFERKEVLKAELKASISKIHISLICGLLATGWA